jgi:hypothetical protein
MTVVPLRDDDPGRPDAGDTIWQNGGMREKSFATCSDLPDVCLRTGCVNGTMEMVLGRTPSEGHRREAHLPAAHCLRQEK